MDRLEGRASGRTNLFHRDARLQLHERQSLCSIHIKHRL